MNDTDQMSQGEYEVREAQTLAVATREPELPSVAEQTPRTPQQNRVEEVNNALLPAYQKAATLVLLNDEKDKLMATFPDDAIEIRPHDGLIYLPHIEISRRLNRVFGPGQWAMVRRREWIDGNRIYAEWALIARGCFIGESVGCMDYHPSNPKMNYSDALEGTRGEAIRRIAGKDLGCGDQCWVPSYCREWVAKFAEQVGGKWRKKLSGGQVPTKAAAAPSNPPTPARAGAVQTAPASTETPEQKKARFLKLFAPYASYATEVFRSVGLVLDTEDYTSISASKVASFTGHDVHVLLFDVKRSAGVADDQVPRAEVPEPAKPEPAVVPDATFDPTGTESILGKLMVISNKEGKDTRGKPWTRYGFLIQDGDNKQWVNTFDKKLATVAESLKGRDVEAFVKRNDKGFADLVGFA